MMETPNLPIDAATLVPQFPPMVLVGNVLEFGSQHLICDCVVGHRDQLFVEDGQVGGELTLEYMAQAVAAWTGLHLAPNRSAREIGYLIGVRNFKVSVSSLPAGTRLHIRAERVWGEQRLGRFKTSVSNGPRLVAEAVLTVFRPDPGEVA